MERSLFDLEGIACKQNLATNKLKNSSLIGLWNGNRHVLLLVGFDQFSKIFYKHINTRLSVFSKLVIRAMFFIMVLFCAKMNKALF